MGPENIPNDPQKENPEDGVIEEECSETEEQEDDVKKDDIYTVDGKESIGPLHHT